MHSQPQSREKLFQQNTKGTTWQGRQLHQTLLERTAAAPQKAQ